MTLMVNNLLIFLVLLCSSQFAKSQNNDLQWLDIELSNYSYPYPVSVLLLQVQQQELKMAYMDLKPDHYNGKNVVLMHGKNFNGAYCAYIV